MHMDIKSDSEDFYDPVSVPGKKCIIREKHHSRTTGTGAKGSNLKTEPNIREGNTWDVKAESNFRQGMVRTFP